MKTYDLAWRKEVEGSSEYDYDFRLNDVGKGQLIRQLEMLGSDILYQYVVFERREETGEILDHQNADEFLQDYRETWRRSEGLQPGDVVASTLKKYPLYQVKKVCRGGCIWIQPIKDEDGKQPIGPIQKGVKWYQVVKY